MCARGDVEVYIIYYLIVYLLFIACARVISFRFIGYMRAPGDVEVYFDYLLIRKVVIVRVYWLHAHQVTLRFISIIYQCARLLSFGFIGYMRTR